MAMDQTVKFRLRTDELAMLNKIAGDSNVSLALRTLIRDEYKRMKKDGRR